MKEIKKYMCEHCNREYKKQENAENHEKICWKNKALKTCLTCCNYLGIETVREDFYNYEYLACKEDYTNYDDKTPRVNCPRWAEDKRTKKQRDKEFSGYIGD
jgi:hypothetical protein